MINNIQYIIGFINLFELMQFNLDQELIEYIHDENTKVRNLIKVEITKRVHDIHTLNLNIEKEKQRIKKMFRLLKIEISEFIMNKIYSTQKILIKPNDISFLIKEDPLTKYNVDQCRTINHALSRWLDTVKEQKIRKDKKRKKNNSPPKSEDKISNKQSRLWKCNCATACNGTLQAHWCSPDTAGIPIEREKKEEGRRRKENSILR